MSPAPPSGDKKNIVKMAYIYFQEGRWDKAIEEYKKLLTLDPEDINTHNMLGDVYVKKGAIREAYDEYARVVTELTSRGQADKASVVNRKIAALDVDKLTPEARNKQSLVKRTLKAEEAIESGDIQGAIDAFGEVLKLDPDNIGVYSKLADLLVSKGKTAEAIQQFAVMGAAYLKNRLYKKAQEAFQKIVELDPQQVEARVNLAQIYIKQGSESDAKKEYLTVAEIYLKQDDLDKAYQYAHKSVELKGIEAYFILGQVLFRQKKFAEAKIELDNLLRFKVNHVGGLTFLGLVFLEQNQLDKAAEQFAKAQKNDKENPRLLEALGEMNIKKGLKPDAVALLLQAQAAYLGKKDPKKSVEVARKAEELDAENPQVIQALGEALAGDGQKGEAAQALNRAAELFEKKDQKEDAEALRRRAQELGADKAAEAAKPVDAPPAPVQEEKVAPLPVNEKASEKAVEASVKKVEEPQAAQMPKEEPKAKEETPEPPPAVLPVKETLEAPSDNVLDLEDEVPAAAAKAEPVESLENAPAPVEAKAPEPAAEKPVEEPEAEKVPEPVQDREAELLSQMEIAANYIRDNHVEDAIDIYQQLLEGYPDHPEVRAKLNEAYTLYVKSGDEVLDALEAEKKAKEEEERKVREERERRVREEAEKKAKAEAEQRAREESERRVREEAELKARQEALVKARDEADRKAREEAERRAKDEQLQKAKAEAERMVREEFERKARADAERKAKEEAERKVRDELERKVREEAERKVREEMERKTREEADRKAKEEAERQLRDELERKSKEAAEKARRDEELRAKAAETVHVSTGVPDTAQSARLSPNEDSRDEFMTIAVADIYVRQGLYDEAHKIYSRIVSTEPDNYEAKKKLSDLENVMRAKGLLSGAKPSAPAPHTPSPVHPTETGASHDKEAVAKKKPGKVGYV